MYAFGLCVDRNYLTLGLVAVAALADSLTPSTRRGTALRVLTLDLTPAHLVLLAHLAKRVGFGSFDAARRSPLRTWRMADSSYISLTTYLRFEFTPAFIRRPYLIYVDADTLVRGDLAAPLHDLRHGEIGAVHDEFNPTVGESPALPGAAERWPHLRGRPYYNAGLLWARTSDLACLRAGVRRALSAHREHILHNDQDALNLGSCTTGTSVKPTRRTTGSRSAGSSNAATGFVASSPVLFARIRAPRSSTSSAPRSHGRRRARRRTTSASTGRSCAARCGTSALSARPTPNRRECDDQAADDGLPRLRHPPRSARRNGRAAEGRRAQRGVPDRAARRPHGDREALHVYGPAQRPH
ncbi:glycosyltransferase [Streptomyces sp. NPDC051362]|uniref:glycosyltransferase n=1 Tax=Streptomyces sp. NPDC051362 TaxID=3365651 RepID=UPI0037A4CA9E